MSSSICHPSRILLYFTLLCPILRYLIFLHFILFYFASLSSTPPISILLYSIWLSTILNFTHSGFLIHMTFSIPFFIESKSFHSHTFLFLFLFISSFRCCLKHQKFADNFKIIYRLRIFGKMCWFHRLFSFCFIISSLFPDILLHSDLLIWLMWICRTYVRRL